MCKRSEIHIQEALKISDRLGSLLFCDTQKTQEIIEQEYGKRSLVLALRALAGAYRRLKLTLDT